MTLNATRTRRQMIGSALGLIGAGVIGSHRLVQALPGDETVEGSGDVVRSGASATQRAERMLPETTAPLAFPVDVTGGNLVIPNGFGGNSRARGAGGHNGIDIGNGENCGTGRGRPLLACADATYVGTSYGAGTYGRKITLRDTAGNHFHYHHMDAIEPSLEVGDRVVSGQVVGFMGSTGNTQWAHLHFEVWVGGQSPQQGGMAVDPEPWLPLPIDGVTVGYARCD